MRLLTLLCTLLLSYSIMAQNALDFDGTDDYVQTTYSGISGTSARTVEAWVKTTATAISNQQTIVDWGTFSTGQRFTMNLLWSNSIRVEVGGNGISGTTPVNDGVWHHVAATYDPALATNRLKLYIDGVLETQGNFTVTMNTASGTNVRIGQRIDGVNEFTGSIDEVRIWDVARTPTELANNMNSELCSHANLKAYYKLNAGTAGGTNTGVDTATDDSGNSNTGTLNGFALSGSNSNWVTGVALPDPSPSIQLVSQTNSECFGDSLGAATVSGSGGTGSLAYSWSSGGTTATATNLTQGTYTASVVDSLLCVAELTVTITAPAQITSTISQTDVVCFGDSIGSATVSSTGGSGSLAYVWSSGGTTATETNLAPGTYTVTVADSLGCADAVSVTITSPAQIASSISKTDVVCYGDSTGAAHVVSSNGVGPHTYSWSTGITADSLSGVAAGTYTVAITDSIGCQAWDTVTVVNLHDSLYIVVDSSTDVVCEGGNDGEATVHAVGGLMLYSYLWNDADTQSTAQATNLAEGVYDVVVTDSNGCVAATQITIDFQFTNPTIDLGADTVSTLATVEISAPTGFANYLWSTGATTAAINITQTDTFSVTVTDANGCIGFDEIHVTVDTTNTGFSTKYDRSKVRVFPNPATSHVTVLMQKSHTSYRLLNVAGQTVLNEDLSGKTQTEISLKRLPKGFYFLVLNESNATRQVVKIALQ